ncbi:phosphatase 2C-like domain-containing protein [Gigaspora rosea]|uniref:Phosphatase 2C-like domain-containing protein n=1 Tax=Gigaspora rosea TaxID=44941 RepID=A0A397VAJ2_9GLOM|nr:phosphatase 2C-like domain-containing protein [Gigaspora rosea]
MSLADLKYAVVRRQGDRDTQMDRFNIHGSFVKEKDHALFLLYDGHGDERFSKDHLANLIENDIEFTAKNYEKAFINAFKNEDELLKLTFGQTFGGTTATVALFFKFSNVCYVANVGDSTAVLGSVSGSKTEAIPVSYDDKVNDFREFSRLASASAKIRRGRLIRPGHSVNMTRALGDFDFKAPFTPSGKDWISSTPHTFKINLTPYEDEFLIMASDGLWNVYDDQTVVESVAKSLECGYDVYKIASVLADAAVNSAKPSDNVTVMVIFFVWDKVKPF